MKKVKILSLIIAVVLMLGAFSVCSFAEQENQSINYNVSVYPDSGAYGGEFQFAIGEAFDITIFDVNVNGEPVETDKISYKWEKSCPAPNGMPGLMFEDIDGATESVYSVSSYDGTLRYRCTVTVDGVGYRCRELWFKEDTLSAVGNSDKTVTFNEEDENYIINDLEVGEEVTLIVNATSTAQNPVMQYSWYGINGYIQPDSELEQFIEIADNSNSITVTKKPGEQTYCCEISDGNTTEDVYFQLNSKDTLTDDIELNGVRPGTYAGTYYYVTKPGASIKITIPSSSTLGDVEYKWYYREEGPYPPVRIDNKANTITVTKSDFTEANPYASEIYECYLEDGNERIRYAIMLFCLDPETPLSEINKIGEETPDITIKTENEDLANAVLNGIELRDLSQGAPIEVTLSTELKQTVSQTEKEAIDEKLNQNNNVGMYLDINLYKDFVGEVTKVSELAKSIEISVDMPENLINKDDGVEREFSVVRVHNGVAEIIPCTYNESTNKIDFSTDRFSTYTVVYTDTEIKLPTGSETEDDPTVEGGTSSDGAADESATEQQPQTSDKNEEVKVETPKTSDNSYVTVWLALVMITGFGIVALLTLKKIR